MGAEVTPTHACGRTDLALDGSATIKIIAIIKTLFSLDKIAISDTNRFNRRCNAASLREFDGSYGIRKVHYSEELAHL